MLRNRSAFALIAPLALSALAAPALAEDNVFTFTYSDPLTLAHGNVLASDNGDGSFTAYSGTLTISGTSFDGVYNLWQNPSAPAASYSPSGRFIINNQVHTGTASLFDFYGLLFTSGSREVNLWGNGDGNPWSLWSSTGGGYDHSSDSGVVTDIVVQPVPSVGAPIALASVGLLVMRRRR